MEDIELEITPTGRVRTIYSDEKVALLQAMSPHWQVRRASNVEFERVDAVVYGWTVRAAHDKTLVIGLAKDGSYCVTRSSAVYFATREKALEEEVKLFWDLLPKEKNGEEETPVVVLTKQEFDELLEYSLTLPTGTTIGKKWKCRRPYRDPNPTWFLGEYVEETKEPWKSQNYVGIKWARIEIRESL